MRLLLIIFICTTLIQNTLNAQWIQNSQAFGGQVEAFASIGANLFAASYGGGVFLSTDNGTSWKAVDSGLTSTNVWCLAASGTKLYAGTYLGAGVYVSTNNGTTWNTANAGLNYQSVFQILVDSTKLFAGTDYGAYLSTNGGGSWSLIGLGQYGSTLSFALGDTTLYAGTSYGEVYRWGNSPGNWTQTDTLYSLSISSLAASGSVLFAGSEYVFRSSDRGAKWTTDSAGMPTGIVRTFTIIGTNIFAGTDQGIYKSSINGEGWTAENTGLGAYPYDNIDAIIAFAGYLFVGTNIGEYRRALSEVTGVPMSQEGLPNRYALMQNYPNPFNPSTVINYQLPNSSFVTLKIYNVLGEEVVTLINGVEEAGYKSVLWSPNNIADGVYFYRLTAGSFSQTRKLLLVK